jgi:hypothetical protein
MGMLIFAITQGWGREKVQAYLYWLNPKNWEVWLVKRKRVQSLRRVKDRVVLNQGVGGIHFPEAGFENPLLKYIANPIMKVYFIILKMVIFW